MWQLWMLGNDSKKWSPLRFISGSDLTSKNHRRRLSDLRYLMKKIVREAKRSGIRYGTKPPLNEINEIFERCKHAINVSNETKHNRERRRSQLSWRTIVNILRKDKTEAL